jgi:hypothetical protein
MSAKRFDSLTLFDCLPESSPPTPRDHSSSVMSRRRFVAASAGVSVALLSGGNRCDAGSPDSVDLTHKPIPRLQPGIVVGQQQQFGYSKLVTLVLPRLASGAIDSLPDYAKGYASMFKMVILANVVQQAKGNETVYLLDKVGVGFAMDIEGKMTIVTKDTANQLGANLGMIDRGVLGGNEDCLVDVIQVARTDRFIAFDAESNMLMGDKHEQRLLRHMIWATPTSGKIGFLIWQLRDTGGDQYAIDSDSMQLLPEGFTEDRKIHVSEGNFLSSKIPTPDRFALESVPQGMAVPFSDRMKQVAGRKNLTARDVENLLAGASESLQLLPVPTVAKKS